ncbi:nuclear transport factor 2 family protein [Pseudonocardia spinosispora]|uniref:nuclear transport factor 2 family protein n=1 Tax=Pseudonocardia spinosispora TaxID=103441 RepID=UPI000425CFE0|nr:nuclear transport factor 2 family protein [Pseudonocardia spinosispora]
MTQIVISEAGVDRAALHCQIEQFYAAQMQVLDGGDAASWAVTFAEDGVFTSNGMPDPVVGRAALESAAVDTIARLNGQGITRRHFVSNVRIESISDGVVQVASYVPVIDTVDGVASLRTSTVMRDQLVRSEAGWLIRHRTVTRDDLRSEG